MWFNCRSHSHTPELPGLRVSWMFLCRMQEFKMQKLICSFCVCIVCCKFLSGFRILSSSFFLRISSQYFCKVRLPKCLIIWLDLLQTRIYLVREDIPGRAYGGKDSLDCRGVTHSKPGYSGIIRQRVLSVLGSEGCSDPPAITHNFLTF